MPLLLGIDVGTTNCKAAVFDQTGHMVGLCKTNTITHYDRDGRAWYEPDEMWTSVAHVVRETLERIGGSARIDAVSVASMGESGVPIDANLNPIYPIISWFDSRSLPQSEMIDQIVGRERIFRITGLDNSPIFSVPKLMWIRENEPDVFAMTDKWLCMTDWIYLKLAGVIATDYSIASRTMALDIAHHSWSTELLGAVELDAGLFPSLVPSGTVIGHVTKEASAQTGLAEGTPVVAGGHDHLCGSVASGILQGRRIFDSSGTAESIHTVISPELAPMDRSRGFRIGRYVDPEHMYIVGGLVSSGICVDWIMDRCASLVDWGEGGGSKLSYLEVMERAEATEPGARGLLFLPHLRGSGAPYWDPCSRGTFLGLSSVHTAPEMVRAVIEGLCFEVRGIVDALSGMMEQEVELLTVIGGGAQNDFWQQTKSNITGLPVEVPDVEEATAMGAALLAGVGIGAYQDIVDASSRTYRRKKTYLPDKDVKDFYDRLYSCYRQVYPAVRELNHELQALPLEDSLNGRA